MSTRSSTDITCLPYELLTLIAEHLSSDSDSTSSLANLSRVCHSWNSAATPTLYRSFRQRETYRRRHPVYHFTYTLLARPDLAQHVKHLSLGHLHPRKSEHLQIHPDFLELCIQFINRLFTSWLGAVMVDEFREAWIEQFEEILPETFQGLLICACPNLESLYLEDDSVMVSVWQLFDAASRLTPLPNKKVKILGSGGGSSGSGSNRQSNRQSSRSAVIPFPKLRSIRKMGDSRVARECIYDQLGYFLLPGIRDLEFTNLRSDWREDRAYPVQSHDWTQNARRSSVQRLSFQHCTMSFSCLTSAIALCSRLREFHWTVNCKGNAYLYGSTYSFAGDEILTQLVTHHAKTLEVLRVSTEIDGPAARKISVRSLFDCRLSKLINLKHLILGYDTLFEWGVTRDNLSVAYSHTLTLDEPTQASLLNLGILPSERMGLSQFLPPSLQTFQIIKCTENIVPHIEDLDVAKRDRSSADGQLTQLRTVKLSFAEGVMHPSEFENLRILGVDVECEVISNRDSTTTRDGEKEKGFCDAWPRCSARRSSGKAGDDGGDHHGWGVDEFDGPSYLFHGKDEMLSYRGLSTRRE